MSTKPGEPHVLDFFAGSGTTGHAVAHLNAEDGGTRQCILVTNNSAKVGPKEFVADGGEDGICRAVTLPRMQAVLTGKWADGEPHDPLPGSLRYYQMDMLELAPTHDGQAMQFPDRFTDSVRIAENTYTTVSESDQYVHLSNPGGRKHVLVWTDPLNRDELSSVVSRIEDECPADSELVAYAASLSKTLPDDVEVAETFDVRPRWRAASLPAPFLREMEKAVRTAHGEGSN